jgi:hypothetical protein
LSGVKKAMVYNPKTGTFRPDETYNRQNFNGTKAKATSSEQLEHLTGVIQETVPEEIFKITESPLEKEFRLQKKEIIKELRDLVVKDPAMNRFMMTGDIDDLAQSTDLSDRSRRKWALLLKYADVWDDDLKNLGYLELKKIYALVKFNG